jgi:PAS domain S-box-containing protein
MASLEEKNSVPRDGTAPTVSAQAAARSAHWPSLAFVGALLALLAIGVNAGLSLRQAQMLGQQRSQVRQLLMDSKDLLASMQRAHIVQQQLLLGADRRLLQDYDDAVAEADQHLASIEALTRQPGMLAFGRQALAPALARQRAALDAVVDAFRAGRPAASLQAARDAAVDATSNATRALLVSQVAAIERALDVRVARTNDSIASALRWLAAGGSVAVAVLLGGFAWLRREARARERTAQELAQANRSIEQQVSQRTASLLAANAALRSSEAFVRNIEDNLPDGVVYQLELEPHGKPRFRHVSASTERVNGVATQALLDDSDAFFDLIVEEDRPAWLATRAEATRERRAFSVDARIRRPDGQLRHCHFTAAPRQLPDGRTVWDGIEIDITASKHVERALRESEARLLLALEASNIGLWEWKAGDATVYYSPMIKRQLGYDDAEIGSRPDAWHDLVHPDDRETALAKVAASSRAPWPRYENEFRLRHKDGTYRWLRATGAMLLDDQGQPLRMLGAQQDITETRQAQAERERLLSERLSARAEADAANERLAHVLESVSDAFVALDRDWRYVFVNQKAAQLFGRRSEDLVGKHIWTEFPEGVGQPFHKAYEKAMNEHAFVFLEEYYPPYDRWFENRIYPSRDGISIFFHDISERKRAEAALRTTEAQLHELLAQLQRVQEAERIRIARQVHDELGQLLTGVKMDLRWLERKLGEPGVPPVFNALLDRTVAASALADQTIASVQRLAADLRPAALDQLGLAAALSQAARRFQAQSGVACGLELAPSEPQLPAELATELFYICQEALTNVARHAQASEVTIALRTGPVDAVLEVRDNGVGIDADKINGRHSLGLLGMRERALQCGGTLQVQRGATRGTCVTVQVPLVRALRSVAV